MTENQTNSYNKLEEDSIDIIALLKTLWNGKKLIVKTTWGMYGDQYLTERRYIFWI